MSSKLDYEDSKSEESFDADDIPLLDIITKRPWRHNKKRIAAQLSVLCIVSTASFAGGYISSRLSNCKGNQSPFGTYLKGFHTEFSMPMSVPLQEVVFTGTPKFFPNGTSYLDPPDRNAAWPNNETYVGTPTDELDAIWDKLVKPLGVKITEEEAKATWGENYMEYWTEGVGFTAVLDVIHTLHCVDFIRKAFHLDRYPYTPLHGEKHLEHCLDTVRQSIQCYGSATLIPTRWFNSLGHPYVDTDQPHTCRDFQVLKEWAIERAY